MLFSAIKPMLLHMGKTIVDDEKWLYDIKWDGWRILIHKQRNRIEAYTRNGNVITTRFPELQSVAQAITADTAIIDCEGVVLRNGVSVFEDFAYRGRLTNKVKIEAATEQFPATFVAFDVLCTTKSHLHQPLMERRDILNSIIEPSNSLVITPSLIGDGTQLFEFTKEKGMEGIVGKRMDSTYQINKRSFDWLKFKHFKVTDVIILGYKENPFTMVVGIRLKSGKDRPIASVEFGFSSEEKQAFRAVAKSSIVNYSKDIYWIEPSLCCTVQYLEITESQKLRIVSFKGFRFDKDPDDCTFIQHRLLNE